MDARSLTRAASLARAVARQVRRARRRGGAGRAGRSPGRLVRGASTASDYAGDYRGTPPISYDPVPDELADPGEVVWTWVPFEEDHSRGKDRPVLVIGRDDGRLLALQMTSRDHDHDAADEARHGRYWVDVGSGAWDRQRRESEARVDRVLQLDPADVRRIGAVLPRDVFERVAVEVRRRA